MRGSSGVSYSLQCARQAETRRTAVGLPQPRQAYPSGVVRAPPRLSTLACLLLDGRFYNKTRKWPPRAVEPTVLAGPLFVDILSMSLLSGIQ
jgi:hypothetical protein